MCVLAWLVMSWVRHCFWKLAPAVASSRLAGNLSYIRLWICRVRTVRLNAAHCLPFVPMLPCTRIPTPICLLWASQSLVVNSFGQVAVLCAELAWTFLPVAPSMARSVWERCFGGSECSSSRPQLPCDCSSLCACLVLGFSEFKPATLWVRESLLIMNALNVHPKTVFGWQ